MYVPNQQPQGQLQTQHSANTTIIIIVMGKIKTPFNYNVLTIMIIIIGQDNLIIIIIIIMLGIICEIQNSDTTFL
jgi:hypothetical protein